MDLDDFQKHSQITSPQQRVRNWREDFVRRAHRIVTPSHYMRDLVSGWGVPLSRISVISNGVTEESFSKVIPKRDPQAPLSVAFVGRLTNWKGVDGLLLAVHQLDGVRLTIMGDGHAYPLLKDLARRLQLHDKVTFKGRLNQSEIRQAMAESHLLVLPSLYEGLSHTLLEAGAQGLPCIASHMGGNREVIVDGMHGDLVDPFDVSALVEKIRRYRDDESLRLARAEAFQKRIREDFFLPRAIPKYETLLFPEAQN